MTKNTIDALINGRQYTLASQDSAEYIEKLVDHVNKKISDVKSTGTNLLGERPIVLAALNICDEYYSSIEGGKMYESQMERNSQKMDELIEENKKLRALLNESGYEIDINLLEQKLEAANKEIAKLKEATGKSSAANDAPRTQKTGQAAQNKKKK